MTPADPDDAQWNDVRPAEGGPTPRRGVKPGLLPPPSLLGSPPWDLVRYLLPVSGPVQCPKG